MEIVPAVVIVPPFNPSPAVIEVTVPDPPPPPFNAYDAVSAYEDDPNNEPVIPCVTLSDPVII